MLRAQEDTLKCNYHPEYEFTLQMLSKVCARLNQFKEGEVFLQRMIDNRQHLKFKIGLGYVNELIRLSGFQCILGQNLEAARDT